MKRILLAIASIIISASAISQSCPQFIAGSSLTGIPGLYTLNLNYNGNGQKHFTVAVFNGAIIPANLVSSSCFSTSNNGSASFVLTTLSLNPSVVVSPGTGNCGGGTECPAYMQSFTYTASSPLPVLIKTFYAKRMNSVVTLNWNTLSEINTKEFIIQKNTGNGFVDVKTIAASGNAHGAAYTATDNNTNKGITFYRLKMVEFDGMYANSETRSVKGTATESDFTIYPNPSTGTGKVSVSDISEPTDVQLIDISGRVIRNVLMNNNNSVVLNNLPNGMYQVRIHTKSTGAVVTRKLTVVN